MPQLHRWQYQYLGQTQLPKVLSQIELDTFFSFSPEDLERLKSRYKASLRVGVALQLGFLRMCGRTLDLVQVVPGNLLQHIGKELALQAPHIASLKAIYRNRSRTLFDHQVFAMDIAGFSRANDKQFGHLVRHLKREANHITTVDSLVQTGNVWLYQQGFLNPGDRTVRDHARRTLAESEQGLEILMTQHIPESVRHRWQREVFSKRGDSRQTYLEWLAIPPRRNGINAFYERIERVEWMRSLHVDQFLLKDVPIAKIRHHAEALRQQRPAKVQDLKDRLLMMRLVCFLHCALLENTETAILLGGRLSNKVWREAYKRAELLEAKQALTSREVVAEIFSWAEDPSISDSQFRRDVISLKQKQHADTFPTRAAAARWLLSEPGTTIRPLLSGLERLNICFDDQSKVKEAWTQVQNLRKKKISILPEEISIDVSKGWDPLVNGPDRARALRALEASVVMALKKDLRTGKTWVDNSISFVHNDDILIPMDRWKRERERRFEALNMPIRPRQFIDQLKSTLQDKLYEVEKCIEAGEVKIVDGTIRLPRLKAELKSKEIDPLRDRLMSEIGQVQLPDLILEVDSITGFSQALLGRQARSEHELLCIYAGMLAHATSADATRIAQQIPQITPEHILNSMSLFEDKQRIRDANSAVTSYQRQLPLTRIWGDDRLASSDSMSLEVSQRLWAARRDPRRRTPSFGTYTHLSDTGSLIYDQPLILGDRQAGVAIEGGIRQDEIEIQRLAVDTHGYTAFAMTLAKFNRFDLCPRLARLSERKLFALRDMDIPDLLADVVELENSFRLISQNWDALGRIAASVETGHTNAVTVMARFGSAASGDAVYRAGVALGRLLRSIYLCDYFMSEPFRREINRILVHGESVHGLQRAIYRGSFSKPRGRREPELIAISGSLTLVSNLCLAWTTTKMQDVVNGKPTWIREAGTEWLKNVSPAQFSNINFNGTFSFRFDEYRDRLLRKIDQSKTAR